MHNGHIAIANSFLQSSYIDQLWILLTPDPPHKSGQKFTCFEIRLEMLRAAFKNMENVVISSIEKELPPPQYTCRTVDYLYERYPDYIFFLCLGEDGYVQFDTWKNYRAILKKCSLLVAARPDYDPGEQTDPQIINRSHFVEHAPADISSSKIRQSVKNNRSVKTFVPPSVEKIIKREQLYTEG